MTRRTQIRALACSKETDGAGDLVRAVEDDSALLPPAAIDITPTEDMLRAALAALSDSQGRSVREQYLLLRQVQRGCSKAESLVERA